MARRTMAVHTLRFNVKNDTAATAAPADLDGQNLADIFERWCTGYIGRRDLVDDNTGHFVLVSDVSRHDYGFVLAITEVGSFGDQGRVVNHRTLTETAKLGVEDAATTDCRTAMYVPSRGELAYFFTEYADRGNGGGRLYATFRSAFAAQYNFTMRREAVLESKTWSEAAKVLSVEVRVINYSGDKADPKSKIIGTTTHLFKPKKTDFFGVNPIRRLRQNPREVLELVALRDLPEGIDKSAEILVQAAATSPSGVKQTRTFALTDEWGAPAVREVLSDHVSRMIPNEAFIERCMQRMSELGVRV